MCAEVRGTLCAVKAFARDEVDEERIYMLVGNCRVIMCRLKWRKWKRGKVRV